MAYVIKPETREEPVAIVSSWSESHISTGDVAFQPKEEESDEVVFLHQKIVTGRRKKRMTSSPDVGGTDPREEKQPDQSSGSPSPSPKAEQQQPDARRRRFHTFQVRELPSFECAECLRFFNTEREFRGHRCLKLHYCVKCDADFGCKKNLQEHLKMHKRIEAQPPHCQLPEALADRFSLFRPKLSDAQKKSCPKTRQKKDRAKQPKRKRTRKRKAPKKEPKTVGAKAQTARPSQKVPRSQARRAFKVEPSSVKHEPR